jgi:Caspase domain
MWNRLVIVLVCLAALALPATAARRVALVIGNSNYVHFSELANPRNDAKAIADALKSSKFDDVMLAQDLDRTSLNRALQVFSSKAVGADIAIVYYAGHGVEVDGVNYLVPIDAELLRSTDVAYEAIPLDLARNSVAPAAKLRMVILDACRNNPFKLADANGVRAAKRGLRAVEADASEFIAYSAKEGTTAQDGPPNGNSPFAVALVQAINQPGLEVRLMFGKVRDDVILATNKEQEPFTYTSLGGEPVFLNPPVEKPVAAKEPSSPMILAINMAWAEVKTSNSSAVIDGFRLQYKNDPNFAVFGALANERLLALRAKSEPPPPEVALDLPPMPKLEGTLTVTPQPQPIAKPEPVRIQIAALPPPEPIIVPSPLSQPTPPEVATPAAPTPALISAVQRELKRIGCYSGNEDGKWGRKAGAALQKFSVMSGAKLETFEPSDGTLEVLKSAADKSCVAQGVAPVRPALPKAKTNVPKPVALVPYTPKPRAVVRKSLFNPKPAPQRLKQQRPTKVTSAVTLRKPIPKTATKTSTSGKKRVCKPEFVVIAVVVRCH